MQDWGYAPDYVEGMFAIPQQDEPDDYVVATGEAHSVRESAIGLWMRGFSLGMEG